MNLVNILTPTAGNGYPLHYLGVANNFMEIYLLNRYLLVSLTVMQLS